MKKITKVVLSAVVLSSSSSVLFGNGKLTFASENTDATKALPITNNLIKTPINLTNEVDSVVIKEPQKVVQNPGSMNWKYKSTRYYDNLVDSNLVYHGTNILTGILGTFIAPETKVYQIASFLAGYTFGEITGGLKKDKRYYFIIKTYTATDGTNNLYVRTDVDAYTDSAHKNLAYSTYSYHIY